MHLFHKVNFIFANFPPSLWLLFFAVYNKRIEDSCQKRNKKPLKTHQ